MDHRLTEEQKELKEMFREFALKHCKPIAADVDDKERFPEENIPKMAELGLFGIPYPEEYGGVGAGSLAYVMAVEELARVCATTGVIMAAHTSLCTWPIYNFGTDEQKAKYLEDLCTGTKIGAFGLTEPGAGTDAALQKSFAEEKDDHYLLNGSKVFITNAKYAETYVIFAMTEKGVGRKGITAFILEKGMPGFTFGAEEKKMGIRGSATFELVFDNVKVPKENLLGKKGEGFKIAMATLDGGRISVAAQAVGIAQGAIDVTVEYVKQREQFGQRISQFQNTQFELAAMQTKVDAARLLYYRAALAKDAGEKFGHMAAMAKLFASETASDVTRRCVQLYGGYGYSREYPIERMMRDAKITEIYEGTSEVQKMVIAGWMGVN